MGTIDARELMQKYNSLREENKQMRDNCVAHEAALIIARAELATAHEEIRKLTAMLAAREGGEDV